jgi:threonyl-tRNA synthetase
MDDDSIISRDDPLYELKCIRHSTAHVMAQAMTRLWPDIKLAFGPTIENGFYYDVQMQHTLIPEDLDLISQEMKKAIKENNKFEQKIWGREEALKFFEDKGQIFKIDQINKLDLPEYSIYEHGDFVDLCSGPHVGYSKKCKHFKLSNLSGAYFRGDETREQLQRVYGTAWKTKDDLEQHLYFLEEAKKRDHRKLGVELELFEFHSDIAPGAAFWQPKGAVVWRLLADKALQYHIREGYQEVRTPLIYNKKLWVKSGHWEHYQENMYKVPDPENDENTMAVKPMNCPGHMQMFASKKRSYRELPLRFHDQSQLHRFERSGTLNGLIRLRSFCQDDAHIFLREEQIVDECKNVIKMVDRIYSVFDMSFRCVLSTRPAKMMGDPKLWDKAEAALTEVLEVCKTEYKINEGDGAFYGPKIDFYVKDSLNREHQCATLQLDFQLPSAERFDLKYTDENNELKTPIVVHRALYGSFDRFIAILIEHYAGAFPLWLAPVQCRFIPVASRHIDYCQEVKKTFLQQGLRVEVDTGNETTGNKLRKGKMAKIPYLLVVGDKEVEAKTLSWNQYGSDEKGTLSQEEFLKKIAPDRDIHY